MIQKKLKQLIDKYCMGVVPTDAQQDEIFDMVAKLEADQQEVADYMRKMQNGPTREEVEAKKKMLEEKRKKEELAAKQKAENLAKQKAEREKQRKDEEEKRKKEELAAKQKAENLAKQKAEEEERKEAKIESRKVPWFKIIFVACLIGIFFILKNKYNNDSGDNEITLHIVTGGIDGHRSGYIDNTGRLVISCKYQGAWNFHEGLAVVGMRNK